VLRLVELVPLSKVGKSKGSKQQVGDELPRKVYGNARQTKKPRLMRFNRVVFTQGYKEYKYFPETRRGRKAVLGPWLAAVRASKTCPNIVQVILYREEGWFSREEMRHTFFLFAM
jgi:hypothetical protein